MTSNRENLSRFLWLTSSPKCKFVIQMWQKNLYYISTLPSNQIMPYCKVCQENTLNNWLPGDHAIFSFHLIEIWPDHVQRTTMEAAKIWLDVTLQRKCESCLNLALSGYGRLNSWEWSKFCLIPRKRESRKFAKIFAWSNEMECIRRAAKIWLDFTLKGMYQGHPTRIKFKTS